MAGPGAGRGEYLWFTAQSAGARTIMEIAPLRDRLEREPSLTVATIAVGKGELVALRR